MKVTGDNGAKGISDFTGSLKGGNRMTFKKPLCVVINATDVGTCHGLANPSPVSTEIDEFVSNIYPKGSHYFWVINDSKAETQHELIVDLNTAVQDRIGEEHGKGRFLLLLVDGKLMAAQRIPLGAKVNCKNEEEV